MKKITQTLKNVIGYIFLVPTFALVVFVPNSQAIDLGTKGNTYEIVEEDMRLRMSADAEKVDWEKINNDVADSGKNLANNRKKWEVPAATEDVLKIVDISQELTQDMMGYEATPDGDFQQAVIFPKGYKFNPLERVNLYRWFAVFNGEDQEQMDWILELEKKHPGRFVYIAVDGRVGDMAIESDLAIYPTNPWFFVTAGLQQVPAIIGVSESHKHRLTVAEFARPFTMEKVAEAMK